MTHRPDRLNRFGLATVAVLVGAPGVYGLLRGYGVLGSVQAHDPLLTPGMQAFVADHHQWFWWAAGGAASAIALIALAWLRAQLRLPRPANHDLVSADGATLVQGSAAADALAADIAALPGVVAADARIWGELPKPSLYLRVEIGDTTPVADVQTGIHTDALDRLRQALQIDAVDAYLDLRLAPPQRQRLDIPTSPEAEPRDDGQALVASPRQPAVPLLDKAQMPHPPADTVL